MTTNNGRASRNGKHSQVVNPSNRVTVPLAPDVVAKFKANKIPPRLWNLIGGLVVNLDLAMEQLKKPDLGELIERDRIKRDRGYEERSKFADNFLEVIYFENWDHREGMGFKLNPGIGDDPDQLYLLNDCASEMVTLKEALEWWALMDEANSHFELDSGGDVGTAARFFKLLAKALPA